MARKNSNLRVLHALPTFLFGHLRNFVKRYFYSYIVRDFSVATVHSIGGAILFLFGVTFGAVTWLHSVRTGLDTPVGTVMVAVLPIILGFQLLLAAISFDIGSAPKRPLGRILFIPPKRRLTDDQPNLLEWRQRP